MCDWGDDYMADFGFIVRCNLYAFGVCVLYRRTYDEADDFWMYCRSVVWKVVGVIDINDETYRLLVHSLTSASVASWEKRWPGCQLPVVVLECKLVSLLPRPEE